MRPTKTKRRWKTCAMPTLQDQTGPDTLIKYMTDGMLLCEILSDDQALICGSLMLKQSTS